MFVGSGCGKAGSGSTYIRCCATVSVTGICTSQEVLAACRGLLSALLGHRLPILISQPHVSFPVGRDDMLGSLCWKSNSFGRKAALAVDLRFLDVCALYSGLLRPKLQPRDRGFIPLLSRFKKQRGVVLWLLFLLVQAGRWCGARPVIQNHSS